MAPSRFGGPGKRFPTVKRREYAATDDLKKTFCVGCDGYKEFCDSCGHFFSTCFWCTTCQDKKSPRMRRTLNVANKVTGRTSVAAPTPSAVVIETASAAAAAPAARVFQAAAQHPIQPMGSLAIAHEPTAGRARPVAAVGIPRAAASALACEVKVGGLYDFSVPVRTYRRGRNIYRSRSPMF